jgi:hypothetical protein
MIADKRTPFLKGSVLLDNLVSDLLSPILPFPVSGRDGIQQGPFNDQKEEKQELLVISIRSPVAMSELSYDCGEHYHVIHRENVMPLNEVKDCLDGDEKGIACAHL